jgi:hypothetical protein
MERRGRWRHRWENREVEWSFREKRHRRQSRDGSGEQAGKRTSFKCAGGHESTRVRASFNGARGTRDIEGKVTRVGASELGGERVSMERVGRAT